MLQYFISGLLFVGATALMTTAWICKAIECDADWECLKAKAREKKYKIKNKVKVKARKVVVKVEQKSARGKDKIKRAAYRVTRKKREVHRR